MQRDLKMELLTRLIVASVIRSSAQEEGIRSSLHFILIVKF